MHTEMFFYIGLLVVPEVYGEWVQQHTYWYTLDLAHVGWSPKQMFLHVRSDLQMISRRKQDPSGFIEQTSNAGPKCLWKRFLKAGLNGKW